MLTTNGLITLLTVSSGYSQLYCRSGVRSVANRKSGVAERSGERELQKNDGAERSMRSRSRNGAGNGGYRNRLERGVGFTPLDACYSLLCLRCRIFTALHGMQTRSSDENSVCRLSVRLSVSPSHAWIVTKR